MDITTSKRTGNVVKRDRSRRIIREAARQLTPELLGGYDPVFVARAKTPFVESMDILCDMQEHLS